jgi:VIT family
VRRGLLTQPQPPRQRATSFTTPAAPGGGPNKPGAAPQRACGGWLRAAVLGAEDGIVSTASLLLGVAAAAAARSAIVVAGLAGLVAGAPIIGR